jgi:hypothetical protein
MNYIKHLTGFFDRIIPDRNLNPTHVSLYIALFQFWNVNRFLNPISISRDEVMRISKISSKATYHKCMRELNDKGYVKYEPSYNPYKGSMVFLFDFSEPLQPVPNIGRFPKKSISKDELAVHQQRTDSETGSGTATEQALVSSINNTNITNSSNFENVDESAKFLAETNLAPREKKEKGSAEKEKGGAPDFEVLKSYFLKHNFPEVEARKFFNYFSSVGWLVGGKSPMVDWEAAAQNWMLNAVRFESHAKLNDRAKMLRVGEEKDYGEAL